LQANGRRQPEKQLRDIVNRKGQPGQKKTGPLQNNLATATSSNSMSAWAKKTKREQKFLPNSELINDADFRRLVEHICTRPGMWVISEKDLFSAVYSFIRGFNQGKGGSPLIGFQQWLVVRANGYDNILWPGTHRRDLDKPEGRTDHDSLEALQILIIEFLDCRRENGLRRSSADMAGGCSGAVGMTVRFAEDDSQRSMKQKAALGNPSAACMEAAGIEPASRGISAPASTCVACRCLSSSLAFAWPCPGRQGRGQAIGQSF
jgi:hypothetical protein